jgi:hypothetical protein
MKGAQRAWHDYSFRTITLMQAMAIITAMAVSVLRSLPKASVKRKIREPLPRRLLKERRGILFLQEVNKNDHHYETQRL